MAKKSKPVNKISHEEVANQIIDDLVKASDPKWMAIGRDLQSFDNHVRYTITSNCCS